MSVKPSVKLAVSTPEISQEKQYPVIYFKSRDRPRCSVPVGPFEDILDLTWCHKSGFHQFDKVILNSNSWDIR